MKKVKVFSVLLVSMLLLAVCGVGTAGRKPAEKKADIITVRKLDEQVVLYTIYRGDYAQFGPAIANLFSRAIKEGIMPQGPVVIAYLNNPKLVSREHWLSEIRIPVGKQALEKAGKLGAMTDVKKLPALEAAVAVKPIGVADPGPIHDAIGIWMLQNGYMGVDGPIEKCFPKSTDFEYSQMKSEIMVPVMKVDLK